MKHSVNHEIPLAIGATTGQKISSTPQFCEHKIPNNMGGARGPAPS